MKNWKEVKAKSITYFADSEPVIVNKLLIEKLKSISFKNNNANARLCLHKSSTEILHDMIILEYQDKKCRKPHKHYDKEEILQMIEGEMIAFVFDELGEIVKKTLLSSEDNFAYRIQRNTYHLWLPITKQVIYREIKLGPFRQEDNVEPEFDYPKILKKHTDFMNLDCYNTGCTNPCSLRSPLKLKEDWDEVFKR